MPSKSELRSGGRERRSLSALPLPRCCSNCWRMKTRLDGGAEARPLRDGLAYACLVDPADRDSEVGELDGSMILEPMDCPEWRAPGGNLRDGIEQVQAPLRAERYAEQIELMKEWNRGHN